MKIAVFLVIMAAFASTDLMLGNTAENRLERHQRSAESGDWSRWSPYSYCSQTCGGGKKMRTRICLSGDTCEGKRVQRRTCNLSPCPACSCPDIEGRLTTIQENITRQDRDIEGILTATQENFTRVDTDVEENRNEIAGNKNKISAVEGTSLTNKNGIADNQNKISALEGNVTRHDKGVYYCGYQDNTWSKGATITYQSLVTSYHSSGVGSGGLDTSTGVFTAPLQGVYTVTWSLYADNDDWDPAVQIYLYKNGNRMDESYHRSYYTGPSGQVWDQGGRSLVLQLAEGDTVKLYCENCSAGVYRITFCISMEKAT